MPLTYQHLKYVVAFPVSRTAVTALIGQTKHPLLETGECSCLRTSFSFQSVASFPNGYILLNPRRRAIQSNYPKLVAVPRYAISRIKWEPPRQIWGKSGPEAVSVTIPPSHHSLGPASFLLCLCIPALHQCQPRPSRPSSLPFWDVRDSPGWSTSPCA